MTKTILAMLNEALILLDNIAVQIVMHDLPVQGEWRKAHEALLGMENTVKG